MLKNKKMQHLLPLAVTRGYLMASQASVYVNFWVSCLSSDSRYSHLTEDQKIEKTLYVFVAFGIGMVAGAGMIGQIQDYFGHRASLISLLASSIFF